MGQKNQEHIFDPAWPIRVHSGQQGGRARRRPFGPAHLRARAFKSKEQAAVRVSALTTRRRCLLGDRRRKPLLRRPPLRHRCLSSVRGRVPVLRGEEAAVAARHVEHLRRREAEHGRVPCPPADPQAPVHGSHPTTEKAANRGGRGGCALSRSWRHRRESLRLHAGDSFGACRGRGSSRQCWSHPGKGQRHR